LVTGTRLVPLDLRRARGARGRLKKTLLDGPANGAERPPRWVDFCSAMDRQAVGEALSALPSQQREVVNLAYFGGMTNREIAERLGVPVGGVRHRLRQALAAAGEYVDRGRATGYRVVGILIAWVCGRSFESTQRASSAGVEHVLRVGMVVAAGVTATAVLGIANLPVQPAAVERANPPAVNSTESHPIEPPKAGVPAVAAPLPQTVQVRGDVRQGVGVPSVAVTVDAPSSPISLPAPAATAIRTSLPIPVALPIPVPLPIPSPPIPPLP
jgi:DNA-binding CsgD family transcriptional regulator